MSLIQCPECGTNISDKARVCPYCGFCGEEAQLPICVQASYSPIPSFQFFEGTNDEYTLFTPIIPYDTSKKLYDIYGNWESLKAIAPPLAKAIGKMFKKDVEYETILVAQISPYLKKLIETGKLVLKQDKDGNVLPILFSKKTKRIAKQIRYKEVQIPKSPQEAFQFSQTFSEISSSLQMAEIINKLDILQDQVFELSASIQDDRIALAESSWEMLMRARLISDSRLRDMTVLQIQQSASEAKHRLIRNFISHSRYIQEHCEKNMLEMLMDKASAKDISRHSIDAMQDLALIINIAKIECAGYLMLDQPAACRAAIKSFEEFVINNKLDDRNTLLRLNSGSENNTSMPIDSFTDSIQSIAQISNRIELADSKTRYLEEGELNESM
jgi:hypothetical protein